DRSIGVDDADRGSYGATWRHPQLYLARLDMGRGHSSSRDTDRARSRYGPARETRSSAYAGHCAAAVIVDFAHDRAIGIDDADGLSWWARSKMLSPYATPFHRRIDGNLGISRRLICSRHARRWGRR